MGKYDQTTKFSRKKKVTLIEKLFAWRQACKHLLYTSNTRNTGVHDIFEGVLKVCFFFTWTQTHAAEHFSHFILKWIVLSAFTRWLFAVGFHRITMICIVAFFNKLDLESILIEAMSRWCFILSCCFCDVPAKWQLEWIFSGLPCSFSSLRFLLEQQCLKLFKSTLTHLISGFAFSWWMELWDK